MHIITIRLVFWIILKLVLVSAPASAIADAAENTSFINVLLNLFRSNFYSSEKEIKSDPTSSLQSPINMNAPFAELLSLSPSSSSSSSSSSSPSSSSPKNAQTRAPTSISNSSTFETFEYLGPILGPLYQYYIVQHGIDAIRNDGKNICTRKFAIATFACHGGVGNRINEFLNTFFGAMLTNRTVVWRYCDPGHWSETKPCIGSPADCGNSISVQPWIGSMNEVRILARLQNCSVDFVDELVDLETRTQAEYPLACGGIGNITSRSVTFGKLERHEMWSLTFPGALLSNQGAALASSIHSLGHEVFYGSLFRMSFQFSKDILDTNTRVIANSTLGLPTLSQSDMTTIGVHSRHMNDENIGDLSQGEEACISKILNDERSNKTKTCLIFVTSDRAKTVERLENFANSSACIPIGAESISKQYTGKPVGNFETAEHGEFADTFEVFQNIELISRASFFVGYEWSTYSDLIASLSALRVYLKQGTKISKNQSIRYGNTPSCNIRNFQLDCSPRCDYPVDFSDPAFRWVCNRPKWKYTWYLLPQI